ncbi:probable recQ-mediated genome instability protein 1 at N-terminal half [Coccomyxa sp. Obi]|nr:probable recQ-mediated genome instability protein 1 at N-terminal half [Coccomyxa sp. Obi]
MDEVQAMLVDLGVHLKASFVSEALTFLGRPTASAEERVQFVFSHFLTADLNSCGSGCLLANLHSQHNTVLRGRHVLQVDEATDTAACAKHRYDGAGAKRCLKLSLTDGRQRAFAFEQQPISTLHTLCPAGLKVAITDAPIKRGMLVLKPENITVLGGEVERLEQARRRMVERWRQPPACSSGRNGASIHLFAAATAAAWPQPDAANGGPGAPPQPPQLPAPAHVPERQLANGPSTDARISPAADRPPHAYVQQSRDQGPAAQAERHNAVSQHRSVREVGQHAADGLRQQQGNQGAHVIDVTRSGAHEEAAAASESSLDSWSDQAAALARHRRKRARHSVLLEPLDDDDDDNEDGDNGIESVEQPPQPPSVASAEDQQENLGVHELPGHLTSLSQLEGLRDEEYPASIRMHGGIVGLESGLQIMDQNRNALDSWSLDVILEDSVSGRMQTAAMCDALITDILGMDSRHAHSLAVTGKVDEVKQSISGLKEVIKDFEGYMLLEVSRAHEKPVVLTLEAAPRTTT